LQSTGVPGFASATRAYPVVPLQQSTGVPGSVSVSHTPLQRPRITSRDRSNARPNLRAAHGPPRAFGQSIDAVIAPDVTATCAPNNARIPNQRFIAHKAYRPELSPDTMYTALK